MAGMQLASFFLEVARSSPRPPKSFFFEVAPWRFVSATRRHAHARVTLDPILEEDGLDSNENPQLVHSTSLPEAFSSSSACGGDISIERERERERESERETFVRNRKEQKIGKVSVNPFYRSEIKETLICVLERCRAPQQLQQIQTQTIAHGLQQSPYLAPKIVAAFFQSRNAALARQWFDHILDPNVVLWNVMFKGYNESGSYKETLLLFHRMKGRDVGPNGYTFTFVLKSCASLTDGEQVHCFAIKTGWFQSNHFVGTTLIDMYSSLSASRGTVESAYKVFVEMPVKNVVAWTAIVRAYISIGDVHSARQIFDRTVDRDVVLWNTIISGYTERGDMATARELFARMPDRDRDTMAWNTVLLGYANSPSKDLLGECERFFFEEMPGNKKNVFSWNGLIGVYSCHGRFSDVLIAFDRMLASSSDHHVKPNDATLVAVLSACSKLGALTWGKWIHAYAESRGFLLFEELNVYVGNGLIDMYARCGCIEKAIDVFRDMEGLRDVITWNSMIGGLAAHGRGMEALELFDRMKEVGEGPDGITFVGALSACVHSVGLVERGLACFKSMTEDYAIDPWIEHYGCMVDLLGRAGLLEEAIGFVRRMPMEPDSVIWSALLGACRIHNVIALAELAMSRLVRLEPEDVTNYVALSNVYGACGRWEDVARVKRVVRRMSVGKLPGWSLVQMDYEVVEFGSSDARHSRTREIYEILEGLTEISKGVGQPF